MVNQPYIHRVSVFAKILSVFLTIAVMGTFFFCLYATGVADTMQDMRHTPASTMHLGHIAELSAANVSQVKTATAFFVLASILLLYFTSAKVASPNNHSVRFWRYTDTVTSRLLLRRWLSRFVRSPEFMRSA